MAVVSCQSSVVSGLGLLNRLFMPVTLSLRLDMPDMVIWLKGVKSFD